MFDKVKEIVVDQLGIDEDSVTMSSSFVDDLGADSLDVMEMLMNIEEDYGIRIPDEDIVDFVTVGDIVDYLEKNNVSREVVEQAEIQIKYRGYIERERYFAEKMHRLEEITIPEGFDYNSMQSLTIEARQKLSKMRPKTIGHASRIPGVSPADINVLLIKFGR